MTGVAQASGPSCAAAQMYGEKLAAWTHSQGVYPRRRDLDKGLNP